MFIHECIVDALKNGMDSAFVNQGFDEDMETEDGIYENV